MTTKLESFIKNQKAVTHYQMGERQEGRPLQQLMKIGALAGAVLFNTACTSLQQQEPNEWVIPGPEVAEVEITEQDHAYSQELTQMEKRMNAYIGADKVKFMKPDQFKKYQGQEGLYGQSLIDFKNKIAELLPATLDQDRINGAPVLRAAQAYGANSPEAHGVYSWMNTEVEMCLIVPAKDGDLFQFAPNIEKDLGQAIQMSEQQRMIFTNYHEAWHCVEEQLHGETNQSDRKGAYLKTYKSENFGDVGALVEMIKDGHDPKTVISGIQQARSFRLLSNPMDANAEENMTHYTLPAVNALEAYVEKNGIETIQKMSPAEMVSFVVDLVEQNTLEAETLQAAVGFSISQPNDIQSWAQAYGQKTGITESASIQKISNAAMDMQQSIMRQIEAVDPEKKATYQFKNPISVHVPKIYEDPYKGLADQLKKMDQAAQKSSKPKAL